MTVSRRHVFTAGVAALLLGVAALLYVVVLPQFSKAGATTIDNAAQQEEEADASVSVLYQNEEVKAAADDEVIAAIAGSSDATSSAETMPYLMGEIFAYDLAASAAQVSSGSSSDSTNGSNAQTCYEAVRAIYDDAVASGVSENHPSMMLAADNLFIGISAEQSLQDGEEQRALNLISWAVKDLANAGVSVDEVDSGCLAPLG